MRIKPGASIAGISPQIAIALTIAERLFHDWGHDFVITSGTELAPQRMAGSLHHVGLAIDLRRPKAEDHEIEALCEELNDRLEGEFDVILTSKNIHIEFQPK